MPKQKLLLSGKYFRDNSPGLLFDDILSSTPKRSEFPVLNSPFTLTKCEERYCIGGYNKRLDKYDVCPYKAKVLPDHALCENCEKTTGFNPTWYNFSSISDRQRELNNRPHTVYLANFGYGITKVGIASKNRLMTRWLEQGARLTSIVLECPNAYEAREIEKEINMKLKLRESVTDSIKRKMASVAFDQNLASKEIEKISLKIKQTLGIPNLKRFFLLDDHYFLKDFYSSSVTDLTDEYQTITGAGLGLIGDILIVNNSNNLLMFSLKKFIGHLIDFSGKAELDFYKLGPSQKSLF